LPSQRPLAARHGRVDESNTETGALGAKARAMVPSGGVIDDDRAARGRQHTVGPSPLRVVGVVADTGERTCALLHAWRGVARSHVVLFDPGIGFGGDRL